MVRSIFDTNGIPYKSVTHVQSCCFAHLNYCFFEVLVAATTVTSKTPTVVEREELTQARRVL